ncbi:MAG: ABC-type polysaccharide/polyol phosphate export permease [Glaciecola sp.]|jgi:ABC-type polysaccharide/polyol phosphate export permease
MGFFWSVIFPIINLFVYMFVFRLVLNTRWSDSQGATEVALVMLAGIVVWTGFSETISRSTNCLVEHANLIKKVVFPSQLLPAYLTISSLINMAIGLPVVVGMIALLTYASEPDVHLRLDVVQVKVESPEQVLEEGQEAAPVEMKTIINSNSYLVGEADPLGRIVRLQLSRGLSTHTRVRLKVGGTATPGEDYVALPEWISIPPGQVHTAIRIQPLSDGVAEPRRETVTIELVEADGLGLYMPKGELDTRQNILTMNIADSDAPALAPDDKLRSVDTFGPFKVEPGYKPLGLGLSMVVLPLLFLLQGIFTVGLSFFLSTLNVFLRDTFHLVGVGVTVWMFGTPIFYPAAMVEKAGFGWMLNLNPMYWLIEAYRDVLIHGLWPNWMALLAFFVVSIGVLTVGSRFFKSQTHRFPDLL